MNNPFQGLGEQLLCRPGDALAVEPATRVHLIAKKPRRSSEKPKKKAAPKKPHRIATPNPWGLSGAECAVMTKLVEGCTNKEIAVALQLCQKTIEVHLHNIRLTMGVSKTFMAALAWDRHYRPATPHPAETAQPLAGNGD
jgi:DNA-binding NarL/FixJ family response regulator